MGESGPPSVQTHPSLCSIYQILRSGEKPIKFKVFWIVREYFQNKFLADQIFPGPSHVLHMGWRRDRARGGSQAGKHLSSVITIFGLGI